MKVSAIALVLAAAALVEASPQPTAAPMEKRQSFDLGDLSQYTNPAAIASLSSQIDQQFSNALSLAPDASSFVSAAKASAYSYLSQASELLTISDKAEASSRASEIYNSVISGAGSSISAAASPSNTASSAGSSGSNGATSLHGGISAMVVTAGAAFLFLL